MNKPALQVKIAKHHISPYADHYWHMSVKDRVATILSSRAYASCHSGPSYVLLSQREIHNAALATVHPPILQTEAVFTRQALISSVKFADHFCSPPHPGLCSTLVRSLHRSNIAYYKYKLWILQQHVCRSLTYLHICVIQPLDMLSSNKSSRWRRII